MSGYKLGYTPQQLEFLEDPHRFKTVAKGRRFGFTHGVSHYCIEQMAKHKKFKVMWGDTVTGNIKKYIARYWMPAIRGLFNKNEYHWDKVDNVVHIRDSACDFRSADRPENWEGFGYDLIILNEAGIILKNDYLWGNATRPMLLDNPKSRAILGGVPKGKNMFRILCKQTGADWKHFTYSSYDNPMLKKEEIDALVEELRAIGGDSYVKQEIFAEFLDSNEFQFIESEIIDEAFEREYPQNAAFGAPKISGVDFSRKRDRCVIFHRQGVTVPDIYVFHPEGKQWSVRFARKIVNMTINEWGADHIFMDEGESGGGVLDILENWGYGNMITPIMFGSSPDDKNKYLNKRVEMYVDFRKWLSERGSLPKHNPYAMALRKNLESLAFDHSPRTGKLKLIPKATLSESPDISDAGCLTFAGPVQPIDSMAGWNDPYESTNTGYVR